MKTDSYKTFTYPYEYSEEECDAFIKEFINLAMFLSIDQLKKSGKYFGLDLAKTAAYEGCFRAFVLSKKLDANTYLHQKGLVRMCVKRCFWSFATIFGYIPSQGQIYFPSQWVNYDEFFKNKPDNFSLENDLDLKIINEIVRYFPLRENEIHQLFLAGYDYCEIGKKLGYKNKSSPLKMHKRTLKRVKEKIENQIKK